MSQPTAFLYDDSARLRGTAGVVVGPRTVVFSPWPSDLGYPRPFVVRVVSDTAPAGEWHVPESVELSRLTGTPTSRDVAVVTLDADIGVPGDRAPGVSEDVVVERLTTTADARRTVGELLPPTFPRLGRRAPGVSATFAAPVTTARPEAVTPTSFTVVSGGPAVVQKSICRIFRWD